jgi:hypothetical protein
MHTYFYLIFSYIIYSAFLQHEQVACHPCTSITYRQSFFRTRGTNIKSGTHTWKHLEAWHRSRSLTVSAVASSQPSGGVESQERSSRRDRVAARMDPPDVEMESAQSPPQPPPTPAPVPAAGEAWSMLSRARALLEEGKPSLALQAVRALSLSLPPPSPPRLHFACCVLHSSPPSPVVERAAGNSPGFMWLFLPIEG